MIDLFIEIFAIHGHYFLQLICLWINNKLDSDLKQKVQWQKSVIISTD